MAELEFPRMPVAEHGDLLLVTSDHLFASPNMAAMAVMGRSANGWVE